MIDLSSLISAARKAAADQTPAILTALGVSGLLATTVMAAKASWKAADVIHDDIQRKKEEAEPDERVFVSNRENFDLVWKLYVPAVGTGVITAACIIGANRVSSSRSAAMAAAYAVSQETFREYKDKVLEKLGNKKSSDIRDSIAQDYVDKNPPAQIFIMNKGEIMVCDKYSGRYFLSTLEELKKAENDTNYQILGDNYASLTDYYNRIGLDAILESSEIGWNTDMKLEVEYGYASTANGTPCLTLTFHTMPVRGYFSLY